MEPLLASGALCSSSTIAHLTVHNRLATSCKDYRISQARCADPRPCCSTFTDLAQRSVRCLYWATERMQGIVAIEALFSGFELELYAASELRLVYWVAVKVLDRQLSTLNALIDQARSGRVKVAMEVERIMMSGLRQLSSAAIVVRSARTF